MPTMRALVAASLAAHAAFALPETTPQSLTPGHRLSDPVDPADLTDEEVTQMMNEVVAAHTMSADGVSAMAVSRPPLSVLIGTNNNVSAWAWVEVSDFEVSSKKKWDYSIMGKSAPDVYGYVKNNGNVFYSKVKHDTNKGNLAFGFIVPKGQPLELSFYDQDDILAGLDDLIATITFSPKWSGKRKVNLYGSKDVCTGWFSSKCSKPLYGTAVIDVGVDSAIYDKYRQFIEGGNAITEPHSPLVDPRGPAEQAEWLKYKARGLAYAAMGAKGDSLIGNGEPSSGEKAFQMKFKYADGLIDGAGVGTTTIFKHSYVQNYCKLLPGNLKSLKRFRRNELGSNILQTAMWPEKPSHSMALGDEIIDHAKIRPWLIDQVGTKMASTPETKAYVRDLCVKFWARSTVKTGEEVKALVTKILHYFHLGLEISSSDADEFAANMPGYLAGSAVGALFSEKLKTYKESRIKLYKAALKKNRANQIAGMDDLTLTKFASVIMDSLCFAGGLSVPGVIKNSFAILYGKWGQAQLGPTWTLTSADLYKFVWEVIRRFPPVGGFPSWDRNSNLHTVADLAMAAQDTEAWGADTGSFKLRPISLYHDKSTMWADLAIDGDERGAHGRSCPAKELSMVIAREFLTAFMARGNTKCWTPDKSPDDVSINGFAATEFTLTYKC